MTLIDIGLNLTKKRFKNPEQTVRDALNAGLTGLVLTGTSMKVSIDNIALCKKYRHIMQMHCTVGIHPHDAKSWNPGTYQKLKQLIQNNRDVVIAVGECGLDYNKQRMFSNQIQQNHAFRQQIKLAQELNLPLFLHDREASADFYNTLHDEDPESKLTCIVHCFTAGYRELSMYLNAGCYIGITGWICDARRSKKLVAGIERVMKDPDLRRLFLSRVMVETDAPFLSPVREIQPNQPKLLPYVLKGLADVLNFTTDELQTICYSNTLEAFNLKTIYLSNDKQNAEKQDNPFGFAARNRETVNADNDSDLDAESVTEVRVVAKSTRNDTVKNSNTDRTPVPQVPKTIVSQKRTFVSYRDMLMGKK